MSYLSTARLRQFPAFFTAVTTWAWSHSKTSIPWTLMRKSPTMRPASLAGEPVTTAQTLNAEKDAQPMIRKKTKINDGSSPLCPVHKIGLPSSPSHTRPRAVFLVDCPPSPMKFKFTSSSSRVSPRGSLIIPDLLTQYVQLAPVPCQS